MSAQKENDESERKVGQIMKGPRNVVKRTNFEDSKTAIHWNGLLSL